MGRFKLALILSVCFVLLGASAAMAGSRAGTVSWGTTTTVANAQTPHGGYSSTTNMCLNCHDVHDAAGDYVLMRWNTVVNMCGSCHNLYLSSNGTDRAAENFTWGFDGASKSMASVRNLPDGSSYTQTQGYGAYTYVWGTTSYTPTDGSPNSDFEVGSTNYAGYAAGLTPGTGSNRTAYKVAVAQRGNHEGHRMLMGTNNIPGGTNTLTALDIWLPNNPGETPDFQSYVSSDPNTENSTNFIATNGLYCASCHTPHADFGQQLGITAGNNPNNDAVNGEGAHANKLLSSRPNHSDDAADLNSVMASWSSDGWKYCASCHDQRLPDHVPGEPESSTFNHPPDYCLTCHAQENGLNGTDGYDFPHTSTNPQLLNQTPDGVCIPCHQELP